MRVATLLLLCLALTATGLMTGFFFAWSVGVLPGLDTTGPDVAATSMTAMNRAVLNPAFAAVYFGTPLLLVLAAAAGLVSRHWLLGAGATAAALTYLIGVVLVTAAVNLPLNAALDAWAGAGSPAGEAWRAFSDPWQLWNGVRTVASGVACSLLVATIMVERG